MPVITRLRTDAPTVDQAQINALISDIEQYLSQPGRATAHPLVTKPTSALVAEALAQTPDSGKLPDAGLRTPSRLLRHLPDWLLPVLRPVAGPHRNVTVADHLELTARIIESYGWVSDDRTRLSLTGRRATTGRLRTPGGRRCILGAQAVLYRLGYGDEHTVDQAENHIQAVLADRGIRRPYSEWNDARSTSQAQVLTTLREAATRAR
ncbi:DUF6197 family protein [Streptantibioticus silvisoli]|uniref:Uncharacterized protein n=1 Tax=Streptantibioticus silvisoli TaxID=2705255 RepID=A0ABT6W270_9ACTN|nr:hypothetical protein [Streptantibioticus silvisoli]MDI5964846.1 hypothetical protein [Streptantibioticus silvisoli]